MRKILVIQTASIGDVILATALLEKLHRYHPDAELDFLVKKGMEPLFEGHPFLHRVLTWDKSNKIRSFRKLLFIVRQERYDAVINIQRFALTGLLTALSGSSTTIGFDKNPFARFFSKRIPHEIGKGIHETERNQRLIADFTDKTPERPRLYPAEIRDLHSSGIGHPASGIYYTISPASLWFTKQFPAERWVELIREIPEEATVYLLGSEADVELCEQIIRLSLTPKSSRVLGTSSEGDLLPPIQGRVGEGFSRAQNLSGKLSLLQSAALMQGARMNFTNDSAPMHLASAVNAPVTVVYCSTIPEFGFGPLSDKSAVVEVGEPLSCRPCGLHGHSSCPEGHFRCAGDIDIRKVINLLCIHP